MSCSAISSLTYVVALFGMAGLAVWIADLWHRECARRQQQRLMRNVEGEHVE
jgi:hypothetical protein